MTSNFLTSQALENMDQILKMTYYIIQDGAEKAEEIEVQMEEEFHLEVYREMKHKVKQINDYYDKKEHLVERQTIIEKSRMSNKARVQFLMAKYWHIEDSLRLAKNRLGNINHRAHQSTYQTILGDLIVQGLCKLLEPKVVVRVRERDVGFANSVLGAAKEAFFGVSGLYVELNVDKEMFLRETSCGGVVLTDTSGSVSVDNTLASRLQTVAINVVPMIKMFLFPTPRRRSGRVSLDDDYDYDYFRDYYSY